MAENYIIDNVQCQKQIKITVATIIEVLPFVRHCSLSNVLRTFHLVQCSWQFHKGHLIEEDVAQLSNLPQVTKLASGIISLNRKSDSQVLPFYCYIISLLADHDCNRFIMYNFTSQAQSSLVWVLQQSTHWTYCFYLAPQSPLCQRDLSYIYTRTV